MIELFWSIPQRFFHNAIAWPELNFIFNVSIQFTFVQDHVENAIVLNFESHDYLRLRLQSKWGNTDLYSSSDLKRMIIKSWVV